MQEISKPVLDAIKGAIRLEIDGRKFFNHAADITEHEKGKRMFRWLAQEEVKHLETFSQLFSKILKGEDWKKYVKAADNASSVPLIEKLKANMRREESKGETEAIRVGMELEQTAIQFFENAAGNSDDPVARKIFLEIAEEEKFHYDMLQSQYDSVTKSGFWMGAAEFKMDGKW
ncbi:MAG: ferritin family protein [Candidatus Aminicenantes bacterium]|nr:ferritin family protein [Candidatus Aminicenantes bacterium]